MAQQPRYFRIGTIYLDTQEYCLLVGGDPVALEPRMYELMLHLCENSGRVVSKDELVEHVWKGLAVTDNAITRVIARLRKAMGKQAREQELLRTVSRKGYVLTADTEPLDHLGHSPGQSTRGPQAQHPWLMPTALAAAVAMIAAIWFTAKPSPAPASWSVQPLSRDAAFEWFPVISPDQSMLLTISQEKSQAPYQLRLRDLASNQIQDLAAIGAEISSAIFTHDSRAVLYHRAGEACEIRKLKVTDVPYLDRSELVARCGAPAYPLLRIIPGTDTLLYSDRGSVDAPYQIHQIDMKTGERRTLAQPLAEGLGNYYFDVSPDGSRLLVLHAGLDHYTSLYTIGLQYGEVKHQTDLGYYLDEAVWHSDGQTIVHPAPHPAYALARSDLNGSRISEVVSLTERVIQHSRIPGSGDFVLASYINNLDVFFHDFATGTNSPVSRTEVIDYLPAAANRSDRMAYVSKSTGRAEVWLYDGTDHRQLSHFSGHHRLYDLRWSPDDSRILVMMKNHLYLMDAATGAAEEVPLGDMRLAGASWQSDKALLFSARIAGEWQLMRYDLSSQKVLPHDSRWAAGMVDHQTGAFYGIEKSTNQIFVEQMEGTRQVNGDCRRLFTDDKVNLRVRAGRAFCRPGYPADQTIVELSTSTGVVPVLSPGRDTDFDITERGIWYAARQQLSTSIVRTRKLSQK